MATIDWRPFDSSIFDEARRLERPVLLLLTQSWCAHCRELLVTSFADRDVVEEVGRSFVATHVDAGKRPDVNERYGRGSWPTVAYLTPDGELISHDGYLEATELHERLRRVATAFREDRATIEAGLRSLWSHKSQRDDARRSRSGELNQAIIEDVANAIHEKFDHRYGGWGEGLKFPHPEAVDFALVQMARRGDERMGEVARTTLQGMREGGIHDPIDGGFFRFSKTPDWREPNHEKLLDTNVRTLRCFLELYQIEDDPANRRAAEGIVSWMLRWMRVDDTGAFAASMVDDPGYYLLPEERRRERGAPRIDETIYTNANAMAVSSLLKAAVVLDQRELRDAAMAALRFLLENLFDGDGGVYHYWDGTYHLQGMLSDQAYLIRALCDASQQSGNADLLLPAEAIAARAIEQQRAPDGGFFDILRDSSYPGSMQRRNRSILDNSVMAEALLRLSYLSRRPELHDEALRTLEAFVGDYKEYGYYVAGFGRAVDLIVYEPLVITLIGSRDGEDTDALRRAALRPYMPSRIVQTLDPEHDPVLIGRSGLAPESDAVAHLAVGREAVGSARDPEELAALMAEVERARRAAGDA